MAKKQRSLCNLDMRDVALFWQSVQKPPFSDCWHTTCQALGGPGYPREAFGEPAYQLAYRLAWGAIPKGKVVRHKCYNRICVNPDHLTVGAPSRVRRDTKRALQARRTRRGVMHPKAKYTAAQVERVRELVREGHPYAAIEALTGVGRTTVYDIATGRAWNNE